MIAKRIARKKGGDSFERLAGYVVNTKRSIDPASWTRLGAYILDEGKDGEKVAWTRVTNCISDDPGWAVKEIAATQARNTRSQSDKSYHLILSFPESERPTREQLVDIEDRVCEAIGFGEHQRISAVHQNTDNWHIHIAINKVHPTTFRNVEPYYDHYRLQEVCAELEIKHGLIRDNHTPGAEADRGPGGRAADLEAHHGGPSFLRWIREEAASALLAAVAGDGGWQALHEAAAGYGLEIKRRGAGLVIGHRDNARLHVKASEVDRGLSMRALSEALGPFAAPGERLRAMAPPAHTVYDPQPTLQGASAALYARFQAERDAAIKARAEAMMALRQRHRDHALRLRAWYDESYAHVRSTPLPSWLRRQSYRQLAVKRREDHTERIGREAEERRQTRALHPLPSWQAWLEAAAARGDGQALSTLRARRQRRQAVEAALLTADDWSAAKDVVHAQLKPVVRRDGRVIYRVADGGMVIDEAAQVRVNQVTPEAALLALTLASERFGDRPLVVKGTDEFRRQVANRAAVEGVRLSFADPNLERQRLVARARHRDAAERGRDERGRGR